MKPFAFTLDSLPQIAIPYPAAGDCNEYFLRYIKLVPSGQAGSMLVSQIDQLQQLFGNMSESASLEVTSPWKWNLRQVLGHLGDGERVFGYRAARIAAGDTTPLPGFDQDILVEGMQYQNVSIPTLLYEWISLRLANIMLFSRLRTEQFINRGTVDNNSMTVSALANIIAGHVEHHLAIIRQRVMR